jgi:Ca-activated chloride channel family protein
MHCHFIEKRITPVAGLAGLILLAFSLQTRNGHAEYAATDQVRIPNRPQTPLFEGRQGNQKTEIHFDPATGMVTLKLLVQDPRGFFIPNIRQNNFVVYENGVRQQNASVDIEHAPVSLALLMECGGRYPALSKALGQEILRAGHQLSDVLGPEDKLAVWTYGDSMKQLADFSQGHETLESTLYGIHPPGVSEVNLYDALVSASERMKGVAGRKAVLLIASGIDTFSKATYDDAVKAIQNSNTPIYIISMLHNLREAIELHGPANAMAAIDSKLIEKQLMGIAESSGGRFYTPENTIDLSGTYDDIMENLKVRYVVTYKSSTQADPTLPSTVRVELVDPTTGGPLQLVDANGRTVPAKVVVQDGYTPRTASRR